MHIQAQRWLCVQRALFPFLFQYRKINDIGSASICGTNRYLFPGIKTGISSYLGFDVMKYKNVDIVFDGKRIPVKCDTSICTEVFEHTPHYKELLKSIIDTTYDCVIITCAMHPRPVHGTKQTTPSGSPFSGIDYYKNIDHGDIIDIVKNKFEYASMSLNLHHGDIYFIGFKSYPRNLDDANVWIFIRLFTLRFIMNQIMDLRNAPKHYFNKIKNIFCHVSA